MSQTLTPSHPTPPNPPTRQMSQLTQAVLAGTNMTIDDLQRNALSKRYNVEFGMNITETEGNKPFFNGFPITYTGVPYTFVVALEAAFIELFQRLNTLGAEIATGGTYTPPTP